MDQKACISNSKYHRNRPSSSGDNCGRTD